MAKRRLLGVLLLAALAAPVGVTSARASSSDTTARAAQAGANPFADPNVFCKPHPALPGRNTSAPGVGANVINIVDMSIDSAALRRAFGTDLQDFNAAHRAFWAEINKCTINGRKINFKTAKYNPLAPDQTGHNQALCLKATEDYKAFVVVGTGPPQVQRCVAVQHKSVFVASTGVLNSEFRDSKGRIITITPGSDASAEAYIKDLRAARTLRNKKVGILGSNNTSTAAQDQKRQYVDGFKRAGIDVESYEVLPCQGTVCTQGIGPAISRMKQKGVNAVVLTQHVSITTIGTIWREMRQQSFKVPMFNAYTDSLNGDSTLASLVRAAGSDGARFAAEAGWFTVKLYDVHNAWRLGAAKETPFAKMCTATLAKALKERRYNYDEKDISSGRWGGTTNICSQARAVAQAIWSLGANVTTERLAVALRNQKRVDFWDTSLQNQKFRDQYWFTTGSVNPTKAMTAKLHFPCPLPKQTPGEACFLSVDRPPRVRNIPA